MSNYNSQLQSNNTDLQTVLQTLQSKAAGGEQAAPEISVSSNGLITATAGTKTSTHQLAFQAAKTITPSTTSQIAVSSGYFTGGTVMVAAVPTQTKTVTPASTTQNITPDSGKFLSKVTVNGDSDLVAGNIKSGVNIFGVTGTYVGSGGDASIEDSFVTKMISSYTNDRVTSIGNYAFFNCRSLTSVDFPVAKTIGFYAFQSCYSLTSVSFPVATSIGLYAFNYCSSLTSVNFPVATTISQAAFSSCRSLTSVSFPAVTYIDYGAFANCSALTSISFPAATSIGTYAFSNCKSLTSVSFPAATSIGNNAFQNCYNLKSLYLTGSIMCTLSNSNAFIFSPIGGYSASAGTYGSIYVPTELLTAYKTATNWTYFSSRFVGIATTNPVNPPTPSASTVTA